MINKIINFVKTTAMVAAFLAPIATPAFVNAAADINSGLCAGENLSASSSADCTTDSSAANSKVDSIIETAINLFSLVVGIVAVIMIIVGGLKYITSGGDSGNVTGAKNTILYAVIGLVVVALAQFIVKFVLGKVTA